MQDANMESNQDRFETASAVDIALVSSAKQGDMAAFEELVKRYTKRVFSIACHITRSPEDAEDVTQETFLKVCCHLKDFEGRAQFSTWLTRIAVNTALTKASKSKFVKPSGNQEPFWEMSSVSEDLPDWKDNPEELYSRTQLRDQLQKALEELPQIYSKVFVLRDIYGFSIAETATALQVTIPVVKTRLLRARLQLRGSLSNSFGLVRTNVRRAGSNMVPLCGRLQRPAAGSEGWAYPTKSKLHSSPQNTCYTHP